MVVNKSKWRQSFVVSKRKSLPTDFLSSNDDDDDDEVPENSVFSLKYGDRILLFYLAFVPDTICFFKGKFFEEFNTRVRMIKSYCFNIKISN